jgi:DNA-binding NtrC family response regulator
MIIIKAPSHQDQGASTMKRHLLIVDDEAMCRGPIAEILRLSGYIVEEASSGKEALKILEKKEFNVIITDVLMPGMNGIELIRAVQDLSPATETIVLSAHGTEATKDKLGRMGIFGYLEKPVLADSLAAMVKNAMKSNRMVRLGIEKKGPDVVFSRQRVLVADDNEDIRNVVSSALFEKGYAVTAVSDGSQAFEKILINDFDLVILDINMPRMGGIETVKAVRGHDACCYILLISGEAEKEEIQQALDNGADKFLAKPFSIAELLKIVEKIDFKKIERKKTEQDEEKTQTSISKMGLFERLFNPYTTHMIFRKALEYIVIIAVSIGFGALALYIADMTSQNGANPMVNGIDWLIHWGGHGR